MTTDSQGSLQKLRRMRVLATGLLVAMFFLFLWTHHMEERPFWVQCLRAFAEAAMVGALADWFAVTALFRHPLWLPIPHTAIIPRSRDRIASSIGNFISENFLQRENLEHKLATANPTVAIGTWLIKPGQSERTASVVTGWIPGIVESFEDRSIDAFLHEVILRRLGEIDLGPTASKALHVAVRSGAYQTVLNEVLRAGERLLATNRDLIERQIAEQLLLLNIPFLGEVIARFIADEVIARLTRGMQAVRDDPNHEVRERVRKALEELAVDLEQEGPLRNRLQQFRIATLSHPAIHEVLPPIWAGLKQSLLEDLGSEPSHTKLFLQKLLEQTGNRLLQDEDLAQAINQRLRTLVLEELVPRRKWIASFIEETVKRWPASEISSRLEQQVGADLQFIRINGTLVGGAVGLTLFLVFGK